MSGLESMFVDLSKFADDDEFIIAFKALQRSKKMSDTLNKASSIFLSNSKKTFEEMMTEGMGVIADEADFDRLNVWRNHSAPDGLYASQIYRWDRKAGGTTKPTAEFINVAYSKLVPRWEKILKSGESINSPSKLLPEAQVLNSFGAASVFAAPIFINRDFWGFMLFSDHHKERYFDDECAEMLKSATFLCANAIIRHEMELEIGKTARLSKAIIEAMPIGMAVITGNPPEVVDCNEKLSRMFNAPKQQIIENYFKDFAPVYLRDGRLANHDALDIMTLAMNGETVRTERLHQTADGVPLPCDLTLTRVKDEEDFIGLGFLYDLTDVKKREAELMRVKELNEFQLTKLDLVIKSTKIGLWDMEIVKDDPVNFQNIVVFSDDIRRMLGYSNEEDFPNKIGTWGDILHPDDQEKAVDALTRHLFDKTGKTPYYIEFRLKKKNGEYAYILGSGETIRDNEGNAVRTAGALKDITEEKNILLNTEKLRAEAEAANHAKSEFLSNMSHEIRTPMNAIIGMTVIGKTADDMPRKDYCLGKIENASQHLLGVINDILDMSKIEAGKFELSPEEFNFEKMLQRVISIVVYRSDEKRQKLTVNIDKSIPRTLIGDDQRLAQVITNLIGNAVKFTPEEGFIKLDTRFVNEENGIYTIRITVTDSGIGISKEQQKQLFQSFQQADSKTSRKFGGTGLGLVISKNIVELMGGEIWLESEPGKGSSFSFTFKAKRGKRRTPSLSEIGINWNNVSIMAVDDDQEILNYFKNVMQGFGTSCDTALSGQEALALVGVNGMYDIYFVDWKMPDMDGIMLARELKAKSKSPEHTIVIMISAAEWSGIADEAKKAGVDKFLSKPLFPSAIADAINEAIGLHHKQEEEEAAGDDGIFKGYKVLLAEDVEINREIVGALLEPTLIEMDFAENGAEAVAKFEKSPEDYDLILMDVQMPEMDGYEATRRIRTSAHACAKTIPVIAMTANVFKEDVEKCLEVGMNSHIGKPLDIEELINTLRKYLTRKS